jgi:hypothetical protein
LGNPNGRHCTPTCFLKQLSDSDPTLSELIYRYGLTQRCPRSFALLELGHTVFAEASAGPADSMRLNLRETIAHNSFDRALKFEPLRLTCIKPVPLIPLAKYPLASIVYRLGSNSKAFGTASVAASSPLP